MSHTTKHTRSQVKRCTELVKQAVYKPVCALSIEGSVTAEPVPFAEREKEAMRAYHIGDVWGKLFDCGWFHITGGIPADVKGENLVVLLDIGGEGLIYDKDGCPVRGTTNVTSTYDLSLGLPGKRVVPLSDCTNGQDYVDFWLDAGCNDLFGKFTGEGRIVNCELALLNENARQLYYDLSVLDDLLDCLDSESPRYASILYSMQAAVNELSNITDEEFIKALKHTKKALSIKGGDASLNFYAVGHGHIDLAWLWPIRETKRKAARTFSTQLELMDNNPWYIFGASQAQLYSWVKDEHPLLYDKIKKRIADGHWEVQGGMWVEPDTNLPSGESLIRQFLYGKRFFKREFGLDIKTLWLPDVFGYTAALPQIIRKCGCEYFLTIKLSWSKVNAFPYHTFRWIGIDGSEVLAHMPPENTYGSAAMPHSFHKAARCYKEKGLSDKALTLYGISDGGGGPGPEHMERMKRIANLDGLCPVKPSPAIDFFEELNKNRDDYPVYKGELYLETHQGTLTSQAANKQGNRQMEILLHNAELLSCLAYLNRHVSYPKQQLEDIWKEVLLYQFHDIIPGSSINRVYKETARRYEVLEGEVNSIISNALSRICTENVLAVFNPLPWKRQVRARINNAEVLVSVPAMGFARISDGVICEGEIVATKEAMENEYVRISFGDDGFICSLIDKRNGRELVKASHSINELKVFTDIGDAWDFDINYRDKKKQSAVPSEVSVFSSNGRAVRRSIYHYGSSTITQDVILCSESALVEFDTTVNWQEKHKMLRAEFPVAVSSDTVACDIHFGHIKRTMNNNTSLDYAQIEVAAQKWVDISDSVHGVAILSKSKYGYYAKDGVISLNLIRSQTYPDEMQDIGEHRFSYAIYPHENDLFRSDVEKKAYEFIYDALLCDGYADIPFIAEPEQENIIMETVKMNEDSEAIIVRLYESKGVNTNTSVCISHRFSSCYMVNMMEEREYDIPICDNRIDIGFKAFEIHTLMLLK